MALDDSPQRKLKPGVDTISPVKRALIEIRQLRAELEVCRLGQPEPVAIVGLALRLPGEVTSPERFWKALAEGEDLITTVPPERWDAHSYWSADLDQPGTMYDIHGGFLRDIDAFDADFFGIHPREAASMDPQQRILLELTWEALERAAIDPRSLMNTNTGIYLALTNSDYGRLLAEDPRMIDGYTGVGAAGSIAAGRLAYFLGTHGPALVVDTACSSSLVAVHQSIQSLRRGETDLAIVGAANLILSPEMNIGFSRTRMLSRDGRSKTFDASADGYVRAEGCCVVVLKRMVNAVSDGDRVLANIHGTAVNQDGRSAGITAPNGPAQEAVMRRALEDAGLKPDVVSYVETHGTGTPLGDPMEFQAIGEVYGTGRSAKSPLRIGSVKTNLGHTEAAAGLAGLIKVVLMMQPDHGIAPHLHFNQPSPQIDWQRWPIEVPVHLIPWSDKRRGEVGTRYAGVSSFGFSGTNAHLIVGSAEESQASREVKQNTATEQEKSLLCLSAAHEGALRMLAERYLDYLRQSGESFHDICYTAAMGRAKLSHRLAIIAQNAQHAAELLEGWLAGRPVMGLMTSGADGAVSPVTTVAQSRDDRVTLEQLQREFIEGGNLRQLWQTAPDAARKVELPVYPFQRKRFWFGDAPLAKRQGAREETWQSMRAEAQRQSLQGPLGWNTDQLPERLSALERLTRAHARNVLSAAGAFLDGSTYSVDDVLRGCGFQPIYHNLIRRWLRGLAEDGTLIQADQKFRAAGSFQPINLEPYWREVERRVEDDPGVLAYLKQCGGLLGDVLTGRKSALETLFPEGSFALAEGLYETSTQARYSNPIVASILRTAAQGVGGKRNLRVLEIGGGTGGTTAAVLPLLPPGRVEYWFTDLSELFLTRARRKFSHYPFLRYALFDLDCDFETQGFRRGSFDLIVAANVMHAARNLEFALDRVQDLLSSDGWLVLLETTCHHAFFDMSTGLIEGWQHFEDAHRPEHPLLDPHQWRVALEGAGFEGTAVFPGPELPTAVLGQHVFLARNKKRAESQSLSMQNTERIEAARREGKAPPQTVPQERADVLEMNEDDISLAVKDTIVRVFHLDLRPEDLGDRDRLSDLGMDSLIALELRGALSKTLGLENKISSTIAFDTGTVGELVRSLLELLKPELATHAPAAADAGSTQPQRREQAPLTVERLEEMSDEEVEQLLKERLSRQ